jgi:hypothetical protein
VLEVGLALKFDGVEEVERKAAKIDEESRRRSMVVTYT